MVARGMVRQARLGRAGPGEARRGMAGKAWRGWFSRVKARFGSYGAFRIVAASLGLVRQFRRGMSGQVEAGHGIAGTVSQA